MKNLRIINLQFEKIFRFPFYFFIALFPLFFLPVTVEFYNFQKQLLIVIVSVLIAVIFLKHLHKTRTVMISLTKIDLYLLVFVLLTWLSFFLTTPNITSLTSTFGPLNFTLFFLIYAFFKYCLVRDGSKIFTFFWLAGATVTSLLILVTQFAFNPFTKDLYWNPLGDFYNILVFSLVNAVFSASCLIKEFVKPEAVKPDKLTVLVSGIAFLLSLFVFISSTDLLYIKSTNKNYLLDQNQGWLIAVDSAKNPLNLLIGSGPAGFPLVLSQHRPQSLTGMAIATTLIPWQSNFYFQILTEYGLPPLIILASLLWFFIKKIFRLVGDNNNPKRVRYFLILESVPVFFIMLVFIFFPPSFAGIFCLFLSLALYDYPGQNSVYRKFALSKIKTNFSLQVGFSALIVVFYCYYAFYIAEIYFKRALDSQQEKINTKTYENIFKAINLNNTNTYYHVFLSKISLSSAVAIAQKAKITVEENRIKDTLITQSIHEAQVAINQSTSDPALYYNLGSLYLSGLNVIADASGFAVNNLNKAVELDPNNSVYNFDLGQAYLANKQPDLAQKQFEKTVSLDPSYPDSHFNLYLIYRLNREWVKALNSLTSIGKSLPVEDQNRKKIDEEIVNFENFIREATVSAQPLNPPKSLLMQ